ncbi:MAG: hypothetical protein HYV39_00330 [Candidatus Levybacteria bacterium]|nr:hypothetical protein [Candidatus Levybacteria bacterium]
MKLDVAPRARKQLSKLPQNIQKKAHRQFSFLLSDYRHPSLHARKMGGGGIFEARIDIHYRFTFQVMKEQIFILTVGPHDEGLGKK